MTKVGLCLALLLWSCPCLGETEYIGGTSNDEPKLYDHYLAMQQMQMKLSQRTLEDQTRLQPQIHRAEIAACQRLKKDREERVPVDQYRQQGGPQFYAFVEQFERYCETLQ